MVLVLPAPAPRQLACLLPHWLPTLCTWALTTWPWCEQLPQSSKARMPKTASHGHSDQTVIFGPPLPKQPTSAALKPSRSLGTRAMLLGAHRRWHHHSRKQVWQRQCRRPCQKLWTALSPSRRPGSTWPVLCQPPQQLCQVACPCASGHHPYAPSFLRPPTPKPVSAAVATHAHTPAAPPGCRTLLHTPAP